jgi:D-alanyl-D-alanine carboxypeptidase
MHIVDGSGLSLKNFATPHHFVSVLARLKKLPHFDLFYHSLPERGKGVRAKSGSMSFIRCCVGYKGDIVFAIFINHGSNSQKMKEQIDAFIEQLP